MKNTAKWMALLLALVLVVSCGAACGKKTPAASGSGQSAPEQQTQDPGETTVPVVEGVEEWGDTGSQQHNSTQPSKPQGDQQQGEVQLPTDGQELTIEEYEALPTSQQQAYFQSFDTVDAFYDWLEKAEANRKNDNTVTGDGSLNLGDYINKNP